MDRASEIFMLFEGTCPECEAEVEITSAGGAKEFFAMQSWVGDIEAPLRMWLAPREIDQVVGSVEFECVNGHKHCVEYGKWGEWL